MQYGFRHARSTADVLTVISHRISEALDSTYDARTIALDISKAFDQVWHKGLLHKLSSYGISGRIYSIIKSFRSSRSMKVVVNGQSSKVHAINAGVPQGSVLGPTLFLIFINDLPDRVIRSFINIFADDTTIYGTTSKNLNHSDLAPNLSSDLSVIVQWGTKWLVRFNASKTKLITFHHYRGTPVFPPVTMGGTMLDESPSLDKILGLKFTPHTNKEYCINILKEEDLFMLDEAFALRNTLSETEESVLYYISGYVAKK